MPASNTSRIECPPEQKWDEVATGLLIGPEAEQLLAHASSCDSCAPVLKAALEVLAPNPQTAKRVSRSFRLPAWSGAIAAATTLAVLSGWWWRSGPGQDPAALVAGIYPKFRTVDLRFDGASYGPVRAERSGEGSRLDGNVADAAARIARGVAEQPRNPSWLHAQGRLALLEWRTDEAIASLSPVPGDSALMDLATAYYQRGLRRGENGREDLVRAQDLLGQVLERNNTNTAARFNRAHVRHALGERSDSDLEQVAEKDADPGWRREAAKLLAEWRKP